MSDKVRLYELDIGMIRVTVEGMSPLICHHFSEKAESDMRNSQSGGAKRGNMPRDPEVEMKDALYICHDGSYGFPAIAFKKAMVRAAKPIQGIDMTDARAFFHVVGDILPLRVGEPRMRCDRVKQGRGYTLRYRPEFFPWEIDLDIRYNERAISAEQLINLLEIAGFGTGVGDWRVEKDGNSGMFRVKAET